MTTRRMTIDEAIADFHALFVLDERGGRLRDVDEYQRRFPGFEEVVRAQYAFLSGDAEAAQVDLFQTAELAPSDLEMGRPSDLGPYRILRLLGRGAQGTVYLAQHRILGRKVALKVLANKWLFSKGHQKRFEREARAASRLDHPGVCSVYDYGQEADVDYIAMRYVEGEPLSVALRDADARRAMEARVPSHGIEAPRSSAALPLRPTTPRDLETLLAFFQYAAEALQAAHDAEIVHRDIKPGNIMVTPELAPVLLDFGLARDDQGEPDGATRTGDLIGTRGYMAPEQVHSRATLDARVDVYALGVVLYECLTLSRPHAQPTWEALLHAVTHEPAPDVRVLNPSIPRDVAVIVQTALEKDPARRYRSARAFADDLRRVRVGEAILAQPPGVSVRLVRWVQRKARTLVVVATTVLAIGFVFSSISGVRLYLAARTKERIQTERVDYERESRTALARPYRLSSRIDLQGRAIEPVDVQDAIRSAIRTLAQGGVDVYAAEGAGGSREAVALEPELRTRTCWLLFRLVEDVDELQGFRKRAAQRDGSDSVGGLDPENFVRARDGAARLLDEHLDSHSARVWDAYKRDEPVDGASFRHVSAAVLGSSEPLSLLMLSHVAWGKGEKALARQALQADVTSQTHREDVSSSIDDPTVRSTYFLEQGSVLMHAGQLEAAEGAFSQAKASSTSSSFVALVNMAKLEVKRDRFADAAGHLRKALELDPNDPVALTSLASLATYSRDFAGAIDLAEAAIAADGDYAFAYLELGRALLGSERVREGLNALHTARLRSSEGDRMTDHIDLTLGEFYDVRAVDHHVAQMLAESADPWWLSILASTRTQLEGPYAGLAVAESGLAIHPHDEALMMRRAEAYVFANEPEIALASLDLVLELHPEAAMAHYWSARCLEKLRRPADAAREYITACTLDSNLFAHCAEFVSIHADPASIDEFMNAMVEQRVPVPDQVLARARPYDEAVNGLSNVFRDVQTARRQSHKEFHRVLPVLFGIREMPPNESFGDWVSSMKSQDELALSALRVIDAALERDDARAVFGELQGEIGSISDPGLRCFAQGYAALALGDYARAADRLVEWLYFREDEPNAVRRALDLLLRLGDSDRAVQVVDTLRIHEDDRFRSTVARTYLADARAEALRRLSAFDVTDTGQYVIFANHELFTGAPLRALDWLERLPCHQRSSVEARCVRAEALAMLGDLGGALDVLEQLSSSTPDGRLSSVLRALEYAHRGNADVELTRIVRQCLEGRIDEGAARFVESWSAMDAHEREERARRICRDAPAFALARGLATWAFRKRTPMDARDRAAQCVLDLLEAHSTDCREKLTSADREARERSIFELRSVLTDPRFAELRRPQSMHAFGARGAAYFENVRRALGAKLVRRT